MSTDRDMEIAREIAAGVNDAGGHVFFVGGYVRDHLLGKDNKDIDIEVHGVAPEKLIEILSSIGELTMFGESFGIFGLRHCGLDIAMPRSEKATGSGHRDFLCTVDPFIGTYEAARRRDFTINALMEDVLTGEVLDHFGGLEDLSNGILRHIDDARFAEDPLRVLRAAQFAARFGFSVAEETVEVCRRMILSALPGERIWAELEKALLKAEKPSIFFDTLRQMEQLETWFPELKALIGVPQLPQYHPEGDVWTHTLQVLDQAAQLRADAEYPVGLMTAALCHDLGKPAVTSVGLDGRLHAIGHEIEGLACSSSLLGRIRWENRLRRYVLNMVELHMLPNQLAAQNAGPKSFYRLLDRSVSPGDLLLLSKADALGSCVPEEEYAKTEGMLREHLARYRELMARPGVKGMDLIAAGFRPGKAFHDALEYAHRMQLAGVDKKSAMAQTIAWLKQHGEQPDISAPED